MPGLYGVITRAPGTLISGLIYNSDHQAHVDGRAALFVQAHGTSLSQLNLQEDPFGSDGITESLPLSLAGELTRLRFVIAAVKTALNGDVPLVWWTPLAAPGFAAIGARLVRGTNQSIPNNTGTPISFTGGTEDFNSGVWSSGSPTRFTAPVDGHYYVGCAVLWAASGTGGGRRQVTVGVNGTFNQQAKTYTTAINQQQRMTITALQKLAAGDYVEFAAVQTSGASLDLVGSNAFSIVGCMIFFGSNPPP